ncbi:tryptophan-rich sensory protein [Candidatus Nesciobacter abundans]|uniref:Tryptophan-rich sensory protein n=1 Tax=Candidatus Nesciobacter abundans TaxID=2601668 RepID=A0A5C0UGG3_9PROT|nr:tryptophan-rich sensory protein [Candidatus Nesciobacter abundans]QEK39206.1 tryptophan-rich sensory protein [Candidatus Nesciobacter abundans]
MIIKKLTEKIHQYKYELIGIAISLLIGIFYSYLIKHSAIYTHNPSYSMSKCYLKCIFKLSTYIVTGIAFGKMIKKSYEIPCLTRLLLVQLTLTIAWAPTFFLAKRTGLSLIISLLMLITLFRLLCKSRKSKKILILMTPYLIWSLFMFFMNFKIWMSKSKICKYGCGKNAIVINLQKNGILPEKKNNSGFLSRFY